MKKLSNDTKLRIENDVRCNVNHSGNHKLTFDVGYWQCSGCGNHHTTEAALDSLAGPASDLTGSGGVVRIK